MLFSAAGLALAVQTTDLNEAWAALVQTDYLPLVPALVALGLTLLCKAVRWRLLFDPERGLPPLSRVFSVLVIGQMVNLILPLRMGEVARAYYMGEMTGASKSMAISTVVVEKAVDMLAVLALAAVLVFTMPIPSWLQRPLGSLTVTALALLAVLLLMARFRRPLVGLVSRSLGRLPQMLRPNFWQQQVERLLDGLRALRRPRTIVPVAVLTVGAWTFSAVTNHFVFQAVGISLPFAASAFLLMALQVGIAVPTGPGRVGVFQYITILAMSVFAVGPEKAFAIGVVLYLLVNLPPIVLGLLFVWQYHLSLWKIKPVTEG